MATRKVNADGVDAVTGEIIDPVAATPYDLPEVMDIDPEVVLDRLRDKARRAETLDDLFNLTGGNTADALVGRRFEIISVAWQPYESDRGPIPQAIVSSIDLDTGRAEEWATTGALMVEFLRRAEIIGALPFQARITAKKTRRGQTALNFERA